jgi:hypothetical protein
MKLKVLAVSLLAFFAMAGTGSAALVLPTYLAQIEIKLDARQVGREHRWGSASEPELGRCARPNPRRYECIVQIEGRVPAGYTYEHGVEYEGGVCSWVGIAHLIGRQIFVDHHEFGCENWLEVSR